MSGSESLSRKEFTCKVFGLTWAGVRMTMLDKEFAELEDALVYQQELEREGRDSCILQWVGGKWTAAEYLDFKLKIVPGESIEVVDVHRVILNNGRESEDEQNGRAKRVS